MAIVTACLTVLTHHMQVSNEATNRIVSFELFHNILCPL